MEKVEIRREMRRRNMALDLAQRTQASACLMKQLEQLESFTTAHTVALFASLPDEPDTADALARWSQARRIVVPRVEGDVMQFYDYNPAAMQRGAFGIAEPQADKPCDPSQIDLIVVPGTAFTRDGARMGRGKGFYDKYLSLPGFRAYKAGICYTHQIADTLPCEPHDITMDCVICG